MSKYTTVQGDIWDVIAKKVYEREGYADKLMAANPLLIEYVIFPGGVELNVPEIEEEEADDLPLWRRQIDEDG